MSRTLLTAALAIAFGLLLGGLVLLTARKPEGQSVVLRPPPTAPLIQVHAAGHVQRPGIYDLPSDSRVADLISAAGGLSEQADTGRLNLAARLQDGEQVWIGLTAADGSNAHTESTSGPAGGLININTASRAELESLSGIGPSTAEKIMAYREANGPFESIEDIMDVSGIGPSTFGRIQDAITIEP